MSEALYTSSDIRRTIIELFRHSHGRRVAISAFVGNGAKTLLPRPRSLELICWPKEGGTDPDAIRDLISMGVDVKFADLLHMKLYWSEGQGAVITSANLSNSALGSGNLKEFGIRVAADKIDIKRVLEGVEPRPVTKSELEELDEAHRMYRRDNNKRISLRNRQISFLDWLKMRPAYRRNWKLACYEGELELAEEPKQVCQEEYGRRPYDWMGAQRDQFGVGDWILMYAEKNPSKLQWFPVDYVARVKKNEKAYDKDDPYQVAQFFPLTKYPSPPFKNDSRFRQAFKEAVHKLGDSEMSTLDAKKPSKKLLRLIKNYFTD